MTIAREGEQTFIEHVVYFPVQGNFLVFRVINFMSNVMNLQWAGQGPPVTCTIRRLPIFQRPASITQTNPATKINPATDKN